MKLNHDFPVTGTAPHGFDLISIRVSDPLPDLLPLNYLVKGMLLKGGVTMVFGPSNAGKTTFCIALGTALCCGAGFAGNKTAHGPVLHIACEGTAMVRLRVFGQFRVTQGVTDHPYHITGTRFDLTSKDNVDQLIHKIAQLPEQGLEIPVLIIFDTLALSIGIADEMNAAAMTNAVENARRIAESFNATVLLVHHTGKDQDRGARGSSAIIASLDTSLGLAAKGNGIVTLSQAKQRDMGKGAEAIFSTELMAIGKDEDGEDRYVPVLHYNQQTEPADTARKDDVANPRRSAVMEAVRAIQQEDPNFRITATSIHSRVENAFAGMKEDSAKKAIRTILADLGFR